MKNNKLKLSAYLTIAILVGVVAVFGAATASGGSLLDKIANKAGEVLGLSLVEKVGDLPEEPSLGAVSSAENMGSLRCFNGDCTYSLVQNFIDASTTIISIPNPFLAASSSSNTDPVLRDDGYTKWQGATSTVELARLYVTGVATSSFTVQCGASASPANAPTNVMFTTGRVGTSTLATFESGLDTNGGSGVEVSTTTVKVLLTPSLPYFTCVATAYTAGAITQASSAFDGKGMIRVSRLRF